MFLDDPQSEQASRLRHPAFGLNDGGHFKDPISTKRDADQKPSSAIKSERIGAMINSPTEGISMTVADAVAIARRTLHNDANGETIELLLYAPRLDAARPDTWICRTEIVSQSGVMNFDNEGSDSLQALALGLTSLRYGIKQRSPWRLSWMGMSGQTGIPLVVNEIDEDFIGLVESLVDAEFARRAMWQKSMRATQKSQSR